MKIIIIGILAVCSLSSCKDEPQKITEIIKMSESQQTCPVISSNKWQANVTVSENSSFYNLQIEGEITMPTPGYRAVWSEGPTDRMLPPTMRLQLELSPPRQMVIQVVSTKKIKHVIETPISEFRRVMIYCGNEKLGEINNVMLASNSK